jgi:catechol 2,3-dioxygenase-like lactoylglutathione lyase family enzyme
MDGGKVLGVAHTGITISDLDRSIRFFREVLGVSVTEPALYDDPVMGKITGVPGAAIRIAYVDLPGHKLELLQYLQPQQRRRSDLRPCDSGHLHLSLTVEDIDQVAKRMSEAGFKLAGPIQRVEDAGGFRVIYTYGFDGLVIELMDFSKPGNAAH